MKECVKFFKQRIMKLYDKKIMLLLGFLSALIGLTSCDDDKEKFERVRLFRPTELSSSVTGTSVTFKWSAIKGAESYTFELSKDSLKFEDIVFSESSITTATFSVSDLMGGTRYSARVKANADSDEYDSRYIAVSFVTQTENILFPIVASDIGATSVFVKWNPALNVTHLKIQGSQDLIVISELEKAAGEKLIEGLTGETNYVIEIYNNDVLRGFRSFKTLIDIGDAIAVYPEDNLINVINAAEDGDVLVLWPGQYLAVSGSVVINKSLSIKALNPADKPVVYVRFVVDIPDGKNLLIENINITGFTVEDGVATTTRQDSYVLDLAATANTGDVRLQGCVIREFGRSLFRATQAGAVLGKLIIDDCIINNVCFASNDFIDIRTGKVSEISITKSTISNSSISRDFMRSDAIAGFTGQVVKIDRCTFYNVSTPASRFYYIRSTNNISSIRNSIIAQLGTRDAGGALTVQNFALDPVYSNNNYYNSPKILEYEPTGLQINPEFQNPSVLNFAIPFSSPLRTAGPGGGILGDPRWAIN